MNDYFQPNFNPYFIGGVGSTSPAEKLLVLQLQNGQSLHNGTTSANNPVINSDTLTNAYRFTGIPNTSLGATAATESSVNSLTPFAETNREVGGYAGMQLLATLNDEVGSQIWSPHGLGGASISTLSPSSVYNDNAALQIAALPSHATDLGLTPYIIATIHQGESDQGNNYNDYTADVDLIRESYNAKALDAINQPIVPLLMSQSGNAGAGDINEIIINYVDATDNVYLSQPKYLLNRLYPSSIVSPVDRTHLKPEGYIIQREMDAIAQNSIMTTGDFKGLVIDSYEVVGNILKLVCNVPTLPIVFDETTLPSCPNYGIKYYNHNDVDITDLSITLDGNKIVIDTGEPVYADARITTGRTLFDSTNTNGSTYACTNIRDSSGIPSLVSGWTNNHWMPEIRRTLTTSDGAPIFVPIAQTEFWDTANDPTTFPSTVTMDGTESGQVAGTSNSVDLTVGTYRVTATITEDGGNTGQARFRIANKSVFFGNGSGDVDTVVTVTDNTLKRVNIHQFTGYAGTVNNINVIKES